MKKLIMLLALFVVNSVAMAAPVNVNSADAKTIADALAGIGQKKAEAIVKYRTEKGPFKTVDELTQVSGVTKKILAKNQYLRQKLGRPGVNSADFCGLENSVVD